MIGPIRYFESIRDPRMKRKRRHELSQVIALALIAVIGGATSWNEVEEVCEDCEEWLTGLLGLKNGIPSHDTFPSRARPDGVSGSKPNNGDSPTQDQRPAPF